MGYRRPDPGCVVPKGECSIHMYRFKKFVSLFPSNNLSKVYLSKLSHVIKPSVRMRYEGYSTCPVCVSACLSACLSRQANLRTGNSRRLTEGTGGLSKHIFHKSKCSL